LVSGHSFGWWLMEGNPTLKFAYKYRQSIAFALYVSLLCGVAAPAAMARPATPTGVANPALALPIAQAKSSEARVPLRNAKGPDAGKFIPEGVTRRSTDKVKGFERTRVQVGGVNGSNVQEQVVDITNFGPTVSDEIDPYWSADEQFIFFAANTNFTGDNNPDNYQLYRIGSNPSPNQGTVATPARLTNEPGAIHRFPSISAANRIAFIKSTNNGTTFQLFTTTLPSGTATIPTNLTSLTAGKLIGARTIVSVGRPAWLSATEVVFSAQLSDGQSDVLIGDIQTGLVRAITNSAASEANVAVSPDGRFIAFDSNATGYSPAAPATSGGVAGDGTRNVFVMSNFGSDAIQVTAGAGSTVAAGISSVQPAWSRSEVTPFFGTQARYFLAYSSNRQDATGAAATPNGTRDIFYAPTIILNQGGAPSLLIEGTNSPSPSPASYSSISQGTTLKLDTGDTAPDGASFRWNDEYPTFPPLLNAIRIGFQSDRKGNTLGGFSAPNPNTDANRHDIFIASVLDLFAPTLLRYDLTSPTGEVVHINLGDKFDPSIGASVRNRSQGLTPGTNVFLTVRGEDLESGINSAYIQVKNPNSKYQSQAQGGDGVEHKEYAWGAFTIYEPTQGGGARALLWQPDGIPSRNVGTEYECQVLGAADYKYYSHGLIPAVLFGGGAGLNLPSNAPAMYDAGGGVFPVSDNLPQPRVFGDDGQAFSGTAHPAPEDANGNNIWIKLERIDTISPEMATQYPGGKDGNGGVLYGAVWKTSSEPSDWFMDVIFYDNAVNPFDPTGSKGNWIIYDNVWGFSTAPAFNALPVDILVVSDYMLGQKFLGTRLNRRGASGQQSQNPQDNLPNIVYGGESYITDTDVKRFPDGEPAIAAPGATEGRLWERGFGQFPNGPFATGLIGVPSPPSAGNGATPNPLGVGSYIDSLLQQDSVELPGEGNDGSSRFLPSVGRYNIWRVLSRGPVPSNVLSDYLPTTTTAPPDAKAGQTTARSVRNVNRMVIWGSSFTQIAYRGAGTIADLQTQQDLTNYVNAGGQLFVTGQDVAFALAGNGQSNEFLNQILGVGFTSDNAGGAFQLNVNTPGFNPAQRGAFLANRIGRDSLTPGANSAFSQGNGGTSPRSYSPPGSEALDLQNFEDLLPFTTWRGSASGNASARAGGPLFVGFNDVVTAQTATPIYAGAGGMFVNPVASGGTAVFASFGFESLTEGFYNYQPMGSPVILAWRGRRSGIMHNITDALRTATITGRVLDDNNSPVTDALIRVADSSVGLGIGNDPANPIIAQGTALTDADGNYQVTGISGGFILVEAFKAGYYTQVSTGNVVHGASRATVNLIVKRASPGRLGGIANTAAVANPRNRTNPDGSTRTVGGVFATDDNTPVPNIPVMAYFAQAGTSSVRYVAFYTVTSDGNQRDRTGVLIPAGQYVFPEDLPVADYQLVVNPTRVVNPATGMFEENTGQRSVTINGQSVTIPPANTVFSTNVYVDAALVGRRVAGQPGIDLQGNDPATPADESTVLIANPTKTADLPGDYIRIEENKTGGVDFRLAAGRQRIRGFVLAETTDGSRGAGVPGVTVRATPQGGGTAVGEAVTGADGSFSLAYNGGTPDNPADDGDGKFPEGNYNVFVAIANGYDLVAEPTGRSRRPSVTVRSGGDTNVEVVIDEPRDENNTLVRPGALIIEKLPPGSVSGLVTQVPGSIATVGATVRLYSSDAAGNRADFDNDASNGITPRYTTLTVADQTVNGYRFNYRIENVDTGTYVADVALRGFSPSPVLSSVFTVTSGNETRNINFTLEPPKIYGGGVQLISIPLDYSATSAAAKPWLIFGITDAQIAAQVTQPFNLKTFNVAEWAGGPDYRTAPEIPLIRGKGYFVRFGGPTAVTNSEANAPSGNELQVDLLPGWNLIGHPFARVDNPYALPGDIDLATGTRYTGPDGVDSTFDEAVAKGYIRGIAYGYTGENSASQYFQSSVLKPYLGYWFRNTSTQTIRMRFLRPNESLTTTTRSVKARKPGAAIMKDEQDKIRFRSIDSKNTIDWRLQLAVRQGDLLDTDNSIGVSPGAKDGFDTQYDTEKPPIMTAAPMVYLSVEGKNAAGGRAVLADDIRDSSVGVGKRTWDFNVQPAEGQGDVTLFWPNVNRLPRGIEPFLVDTATGKRIPLRSASSYKYTPSSEETSGRSVHRFQIEVAKPSSIPLMLTNVRQTRVDGGRGIGQDGYRISFKVTREADVTAEIQSLTGRTVTRLTTRGRSVGETSILWNRRSQDGSELPAGAYVLTLTAKDADGSVVQVRQPIMSLR
jgi:hypothetical protein